MTVFPYKAKTESYGNHPQIETRIPNSSLTDLQKGLKSGKYLINGTTENKYGAGATGKTSELKPSPITESQLSVTTLIYKMRVLQGPISKGYSVIVKKLLEKQV